MTEVTTMIVGGAFLLARVIYLSRIWLKPPLFLKVFVWLIGNANYSDQEKNGRLYKRGELTTTYAELINAMRHYENRATISPTIKQIRIILAWLESEGMILVSPLQIERLTGADPTAYTRAYVGIKIAIVNYDTYQSQENYKGRHQGKPSSRLGHNNNNEEIKRINTMSELDHSDFELFYKSYPKREARTKALHAWTKLHPDNNLQQIILNAIEKQKLHKSGLKSRNEFCPEWPMPATWLNQRRWEDEIPADGIDNSKPIIPTTRKCPRCMRNIVVESDLTKAGCVYCEPREERI